MLQCSVAVLVYSIPLQCLGYLTLGSEYEPIPIMPCFHRAARSQQGNKAPAVELSSIYYDDPKMKPIAYNIAMKSAFWAAMQATEQAFRRWHQVMSRCQVPRDMVDLSAQLQPGSASLNTDGRADGRKCKGRARLGGIVKGLIVSGLVLIVHKKIAH